MTMRALAALLLLSSALPAPALAANPAPEASPAAGDRVFTALRPGTYSCAVKGMLCAACADAIAQAVLEVPGVEKARVDFDGRALLVTVAEGKSVSVVHIRRALQRAARRIDLGTAFYLGRIRYVP